MGSENQKDWLSTVMFFEGFEKANLQNIIKIWVDVLIYQQQTITSELLQDIAQCLGWA